MRHLPCLPLLIALVFVAGAEARDFYVDNVAGDDRLSGATPTNAGQSNGPFRTIARALRAAGHGDQISIAATDQPYRESLTLQGARHSGSPVAPFTIHGNGAILDGAEPVPEDAWEVAGEDIFRFAPPSLSHQLLFLEGKPATRFPLETSRRLSELQPLGWGRRDGAIHFRVEPNRLPSTYKLSYAARPVGITLYEVHDVVILDLVVQGYQLDGVNAHDGVTGTLLAGLTSRGNGRSGISIGGASRVQLQGCLVGNNGTAQVRAEGYSHVAITGSDLIPNTAPAIVVSGHATVLVDGQPWQPETETP